MERWNLLERPLLTADSGFGGFELAKKWTDWGVQLKNKKIKKKNL